MKASVLKKRQEKLLKRQQFLLHQLVGVFRRDFNPAHGIGSIMADCAFRMRQSGLTPDHRLDECLVLKVMSL